MRVNTWARAAGLRRLLPLLEPQLRSSRAVPQRLRSTVPSTRFLARRLALAAGSRRTHDCIVSCRIQKKGTVFPIITWPSRWTSACSAGSKACGTASTTTLPIRFHRRQARSHWSNITASGGRPQKAGRIKAAGRAFAARPKPIPAGHYDSAASEAAAARHQDV